MVHANKAWHTHVWSLTPYLAAWFQRVDEFNEYSNNVERAVLTAGAVGLNNGWMALILIATNTLPELKSWGGRERKECNQEINRKETGVVTRGRRDTKDIDDWYGIAGEVNVPGTYSNVTLLTFRSRQVSRNTVYIAKKGRKEDAW